MAKIGRNDVKRRHNYGLLCLEKKVPSSILHPLDTFSSSSSVAKKDKLSISFAEHEQGSFTIEIRTCVIRIIIRRCAVNCVVWPHFHSPTSQNKRPLC